MNVPRSAGTKPVGSQDGSKMWLCSGQDCLAGTPAAGFRADATAAGAVAKHLLSGLAERGSARNAATKAIAGSHIH